VNARGTTTTIRVAIATLIKDCPTSRKGCINAARPMVVTLILHAILRQPWLRCGRRRDPAVLDPPGRISTIKVILAGSRKLDAKRIKPGFDPMATILLSG
jgi:hypothetical protein